MKPVLYGLLAGVMFFCFFMAFTAKGSASGTTCDTLEIRKLDEIMNMVSGIQADVEIGFGFNKREE